jgi:hypothetical protein
VERLRRAATVVAVHLTQYRGGSGEERRNVDRCGDPVGGCGDGHRGPGDVGIWSYGLDASYHLATPSPLVQPFLIGGLGAKTYDFDGLDALTHFMWNVGAGVDVALHPRAALRLEARNNLSLFDPEVTGVNERAATELRARAGALTEAGSSPTTP